MSHEPNDLAPELKSLEAALAGLAPRGSAIDRDGLLYAAGAAAAQGVTKRRLLAFGLPTVAAMCLVPLFIFGGLWIRERQQLMAEREAHKAELKMMVAQVQAAQLPAADIAVSTPADHSAPPVGRNAYLRLRNVVLTSGAEALESPASNPGAQIESLRARDVWPQGI